MKEELKVIEMDLIRWARRVSELELTLVTIVGRTKMVESITESKEIWYEYIEWMKNKR